MPPLDLSETHILSGGTWLPRSWYEQPLAADPAEVAVDHSLDDLDIQRYKAELDRRFAAATRTAEASNLTADARQYAMGFRNGLKEALALLGVGRRVPGPSAHSAPDVPPHSEEPHT